MTAVLEHVIDPASLAPDLPVAEKLRWVLDRISDILENRLGPGATAAIIADSDPEFTTARARLAVRLSALADLMNLDIKTGRLQQNIDPDRCSAYWWAPTWQRSSDSAPHARGGQTALELLTPAVTPHQPPR